VSKQKQIHDLLVKMVQEPDPVKKKEIDHELYLVQMETIKEAKNYEKDSK